MKLFKLIFSRFFIISVAIILQMVFYVLLIAYGVHKILPVSIIITVAGVAVFLRVLTRDIMPEQKLLWTALLGFVPLVGIGLYIMIGGSRRGPRAKEHIRNLFFRQAPSVNPAEDIPEDVAGQVKYLINNAGTAAYRGNSTKYFACGEDYLKALLSDLKRAEKYIFMEFFIVEPGKMLDPILDILEEKAKDGVEVRMMYDDIGSVWKVPGNYFKKLKKRGIDCVKFNKYIPFVTNQHNNRDHRKIVVIDGKVAYTGGVNLADEYINEGIDFYWKDTGVRIEGNAVGEFAELFLQLYGMTVKDYKLDFAKYINPETVDTGEGGIVVPFGSGPSFFYNTFIAAEAFINIISGARRELILTTPYLIADYSLMRALCMAVARGVKVKVVIPDIPDKKVIYFITKKNAERLKQKGVEVYRSTGAFLHAKSIVADGTTAIVGTINFDYRSLIHHFENGVWMHGSRAVGELYADVTALCCKENVFDRRKRNGFFARLLADILEIFAPLF